MLPTDTIESYRIGRAENIDLKLISKYISVVEHGGFTQAQESLNIALSSISTYMQELETKLGFKLCNRGRGGFSLTNDGETVYLEAKKMFNAINTFDDNISILNKKLMGELNLGILDNSTMTPSARIPTVIHEFTTLHPDVNINIQVLSSEKIMSNIINGSLDLGVCISVEEASKLRTLIKFPVTVDLYCGCSSYLFEKSAVTPDDLKNIRYAKGCFSPSKKHESSLKLPTFSASSYLSEGLAFLIMSGRYVGFLPRQYAKNWVDNDELKALSTEIFSFTLEQALVVRRGEKVRPVMQAFYECFSKINKKWS